MGFDTGGFDALSERALVRFKRHARRTYRVSARTGRPDDVSPLSSFSGRCDARIDTHTVMELRSWLERGWSLPIGRFRLTAIPPTRTRLNRRALLREDVAGIWLRLIESVRRRGGTIDGPYGDTWRPLGFHAKNGVSPRSFHIAGRAIDLNQFLAQPPHQRYFLAAEPLGGNTYFRIWCRTTRQDGSQGVFLRGGSFPCWRYGMADFPNPGGWYLDLTSILEREGGFERIPAQPGWETSYLRSEWWHYQYGPGKQETFLDECELVGIGEERLAGAGYSVEEMDGPPG
ncbi:MAG: hypothetical protein R2762_08845 [Bryobacteraceae bacterium]